MKRRKIGIVGAGMTGLFLAKKLRSAGIDHFLIDKGRGVGGRVANRRFSDSAFDTGAQIIRARSSGFREEMLLLEKAGKAKLWEHDKDGNPVYFGSGRITEIPKYLLDSSTLFSSWQLLQIQFENESWLLKNTNNEILECSDLVITAPAPQAANILSNSSISLNPKEKQCLDSIQYRKTLVLIGCLETIPKAWGMPYLKPELKNIDTIVNNTSKEVTTVPNAMTIHFGEDFSLSHYGKTDEEILELMMRELASFDLKWKSVQVKKWGFSEPLQTFGEEAWKPHGLNHLILGGDSFGGGSVEGAWRSSRKIYEYLTQ